MKLKPAYGTECYLTVGGYYAIKQDNPMGDPKIVILLTRDQVANVIKDMQECLYLHRWGDLVEEDNGSF